MNRLPVLLTLLLCPLIGHSANFIVVPNDLEFTEGNASTFVPFLIEHRFKPTMRYQQVYDSSQFAVINSIAGYITHIYLRGDRASDGFNITITNIQLDLSTTSKAPDGLSPVFAENVGSDDGIVFGPGPLIVNGGCCGNPAPFDIKIKLSAPFYYRPIAGNLLMDVRNNIAGDFLPGPIGPVRELDAVGVLGDPVSTVSAYSVSNTFGQTGTGGLVTGFEFYPVPALSIQQTNNSVVLTWPVEPTVFVLQRSDVLGAEANWQAITNGIVENALIRTLKLPMNSLDSREFYRLLWPSAP